MVEPRQQELKKQLWNIANTLRGSMLADDFLGYLRGLIFYKYLSDKLNLYANELLLEDGISWRISLTPSIDCRVINIHTTLTKHLFKLTITDTVLTIQRTAQIMMSYLKKFMIDNHG